MIDDPSEKLNIADLLDQLRALGYSSEFRARRGKRVARLHVAWGAPGEANS